MKLIGLMHVRNEQWVLGMSLPATLHLVDEIVVLDHASTDTTPQIIASVAAECPGRVHRLDWTGRHYNEIAIRQRLLEVGRELGGTHFFMIDADEVVTGNQIKPIREAMRALEPGQGLELPWLAMWESLDLYRQDDSVWSDNYLVFGFADREGVAYRAQADGYDVHGQVPRGLDRPFIRPLEAPSEGGVMHLQFANRRRLLAKHVWYKMHDTVRFPGRETPEQLNEQYGHMIDASGLATREVENSWWRPYRGLRARIRFDDRPWHEDEVLRFWHEHGPEVFEGLELHGLPQRLEAERPETTPARAG